MDLNSGEVLEGEKRPTSESLVHLPCYRRRVDIGAVIHTHPRYTVALSSQQSVFSLSLTVAKVLGAETRASIGSLFENLQNVVPQNKVISLDGPVYR